MNHLSNPFVREKDWLKRWSVYTPNKTAIKEGETGRCISYRDCDRYANRLARVFRERYQIQKGDRVAVLSQNEIEYVLLFFALQRLGAILVPLNFRLTVPEISYVLKDCNPSLLIYGKQYESMLPALSEAALPPHLLPFGGDALSMKADLYNETLDAAPLSGVVELTHEDPCMILYTSGTTGFPKGAVITAGMIFWNSVNTSLRLNLSQNDVTLGFLPFFHTGAWNVLNLPLLHHGATVVFINKFNPDLVLKLCDQERMTILFGVPTTLDLMSRCESFAQCSLNTLRYAVVGGEPMPKKLILDWAEKGVPIRQGYGLTEFGPNVFSLNEEDAIRKIGSIGFPNFYVDVKLVDEHGNPVEGEGVGELALSGPMCTPGYWNHPEGTQKAIRDGWFYTGDLLRRDSEGYYYVVGRKKDMFISGGENVYPAEVEQVIRSFPGVREVAVVGVPDSKWGETGKAYVAWEQDARPDQEGLLEHCLLHLAKYKVPKQFETVDALPRGESGKVLKAKLQDANASGK